ncbi:hypothetical protein QBC39DRAFT_361658 [Podospora conica]|nr:hypothetical protein QBC39DRAFT_361658 [Schizothecium conicum]
MVESERVREGARERDEWWEKSVGEVRSVSRKRSLMVQGAGLRLRLGCWGGEMVVERLVDGTDGPGALVWGKERQRMSVSESNRMWCVFGSSMTTSEGAAAGELTASTWNRRSWGCVSPLAMESWCLSSSLSPWRMVVLVSMREVPGGKRKNVSSFLWASAWTSRKWMALRGTTRSAMAMWANIVGGDVHSRREKIGGGGHFEVDFVHVEVGCFVVGEAFENLLVNGRLLFLLLLCPRHH